MRKNYFLFSNVVDPDLHGTALILIGPGYGSMGGQTLATKKVRKWFVLKFSFDGWRLRL
jgi:hypothetical protein